MFRIHTLDICECFSLTFYFSHFRPSSKDVSQSFRVENIIVHPDYISDHPSNQHDLAVIKIREDKKNEDETGEKND